MSLNLYTVELAKLIATDNVGENVERKVNNQRLAISTVLLL